MHMRSSILPVVILLSAPLHAMPLERYQAVEIQSQDLRPGLNARQSWRQSDVADYRYQLTARCLCAYHGSSRVYVVDRQVVRVEDESGRPRPMDARGMQDLRIEALFSLIDRYASQQPDGIEVRMNRYLGYPERIRIDPSYRLADDEIDLTITNFQLLKPR